MSFSFGDKIKVQIFGQSHSEMLGVVIDGLPAGIVFDYEKVQKFLIRRQGGKGDYTTARRESDVPKIVSGLADGKTCGAPLCALFENGNTSSKDYSEIARVPRPSHADYNAYVKYGKSNDIRGGGQFSGRMTLALCFAGALCMQLLEREGIYVQSHIYSVGRVKDTPYDTMCPQITAHDESGISVNDSSVKADIIAEIKAAAQARDSVGGVIECAVSGLPVGVGEPMFDGIENKISHAVFAIPGVRGIEFGAGFEAAYMRGSEHNDPYSCEDGKVMMKSNNAGGVLGGISTGMPLIFKVAMKPTPSIGIEQSSVDLETMSNATLAVKGRHDPCIVPRALPCVEAAAALAIINLM